MSTKDEKRLLMTNNRIPLEEIVSLKDVRLLSVQQYSASVVHSSQALGVHSFMSAINVWC